MKNSSLELELAARQPFVKYMLKQTARAVRLVNNEPANTGSGLFYATGERLFLLSVLDIFKGECWFVETDTVVNYRPIMLRLPRMNWAVRGTVGPYGRPAPICHDGLAWAEFDTKAMSKAFGKDKSLNDQVPGVNAYTGPLDSVLKADEPYSFVAAPGREFHRSSNIWPVEPMYELGMTFDGDDDATGFHRFQLAGNHKGNEFYKGCSGAPIAMRDGAIVALVQGGKESEGVVLGVPLRLYASALQLSGV